jgi:hypothetical protein
VANRVRVEPIAADTRTLAQYYRRKLARQRRYRRGLADHLLKKIFTTDLARPGAARAATVLRARKSALVATVSRELGIERYSVYQILRMLIERCDALKLHVRAGRRSARSEVHSMLARLSRLYAQGETPQLPL